MKTKRQEQMFKLLRHGKSLRRWATTTTTTTNNYNNGSAANRHVCLDDEIRQNNVSNNNRHNNCSVTFKQRTRSRYTTTRNLVKIMAEEEVSHSHNRQEEREGETRNNSDNGRNHSFNPGPNGETRGGRIDYIGRGRGRGPRTHTRWSDNIEEGHQPSGSAEALSSPQQISQQQVAPHWTRPPFPPARRNDAAQYFPNNNPHYHHLRSRAPFPPSQPMTPFDGNNYYGGGRGGSYNNGQENWRTSERWQQEETFVAQHRHHHHNSPLMSNPFHFRQSSYQYQQNPARFFHHQHQYQYYQQSRQQVPFPNNCSQGLFELRDWGNNTSNSSNNNNNFSSYRPRKRLSLDVFPRKWEQVQSAGSDIGGLPISVMCYNVLAPTLQKDHQYLYQQCDPAAVDFSYRKSCFFKEIQVYAPDIVCLQEVEASLVHEYNAFFQEQGYAGVYKKRTGDKCDGCAIYYRDNKFNLIDSISVEYLQRQALPLLDRDNIGLLVKLETNQNGQKIVVATTHLLFNPKRTDIKIGQAMLLLAELDRMSCYGIDETDGSPLYHPTIVTGDFNADPNHTISQLFSEGNIFVDKDFLSSSAKYKTIHTSQLGISDECQHYELKTRRREQFLSADVDFEYHSSETESYVNLKTSIHHFHPSPDKVDLQNEMNIIGQEGTRIISQSSSSITTRTTTTEQQENALSEEDNQEENGTTSSGRKMSHAFNFKDVYGFITEDKDEKETFVTTQHKKWVRVDYIYYSTKPQKRSKKGRRETKAEGNLKLLRRLKLPTRSECKFMRKIPCEGSSSDHFPLLAEFLLTSPTTPAEYEVIQID